MTKIVARIQQVIDTCGPEKAVAMGNNLQFYSGKVYYIQDRSLSFFLRGGGGGMLVFTAVYAFLQLQCMDASLSHFLLLQTTGTRCMGFSSCGMWALDSSIVVVDGLSGSMACGIFLDRGSNLCLLQCRSYLCAYMLIITHSLLLL